MESTMMKTINDDEDNGRIGLETRWHWSRFWDVALVSALRRDTSLGQRRRWSSIKIERFDVSPWHACYVCKGHIGTSWDIGGIFEKVCFGQNFDSGTNPTYLGDKDSNGMLDFWKLQIKVRKRSYVYLEKKIMFPPSRRLKALNAF